MKRKLSVLRIAWLAGLGALGAQWVFAERARSEAAQLTRYGAEIAVAQALDTRLHEQVLQSRQGLVTHYDDIVRSVVALDEVLAALQEPPPGLTEAHRVALREAARSAALAHREEAALVEGFKTENAVLRSSARIFPMAARQLRDELRRSQGADAGRLVNDLLVAVLQHEASPTAAHRELALEAHRAVEEAWFGAASVHDVETVLMHSEAINERVPRVAELVRELLVARSREAIATLSTRTSEAVAAEALEAERRRVAIFLSLAAVAALMLADLVQRYRSQAQHEALVARRLASANDALLREQAREKELSDLKTRFVSMTSHEFRTPLSVILSSAELLEAYGDRWTPAKRSDHFARVKGAVDTMKELLDAVLVLGKSDAGKLEFRPAPMDVSRFVHEVVDSMASTFDDAHPVELAIDEPLPEARVDEKLATHVLSNLLSNAVKYSPAGGPVELSARREGADLVLTVSDHGIGIAECDRERLFESFHRGSNVGVIPGTGLGLAVVKRAAVAHGGDVEVRSTEGEGTTFEVRLRAFDPS